jgi:glycine cleavage system H protein
MIPEGLKYTKEHEWARLEGDTVTIGITHWAQEQLSDVVFVELPAVGRTVREAEGLGVIEAVKTVSDVYAPVAGEVVAVNAALADNPGLVNQSPYEQGWMVKLKVQDAKQLEGLLDARAYAALLAEAH